MREGEKNKPKKNNPSKQIKKLHQGKSKEKKTQNPIVFFQLLQHLIVNEMMRGL